MTTPNTMESLRCQAAICCGALAPAHELAAVEPLVRPGALVAWLRAIRATENALYHAERRADLDIGRESHDANVERLSAARYSLSRLRDALEEAADRAFTAAMEPQSEPRPIRGEVAS